MVKFLCNTNWHFYSLISGNLMALYHGEISTINTFPSPQQFTSDVTFLLSLFCPRAAIDRSGRYMATSGLDSTVKIWDLRMYKCLHSYRTAHPAMSLDISDTGLLAMAYGRSADILKDAFTKPTDVTYLRHTIRTPDASLGSGAGSTASNRFVASNIQTMSVKFRPYEDVLAIGHTHGLSTIIVPGKYSPRVKLHCITNCTFFIREQLNVTYTTFFFL